jgi:uncharacterized membrane protein
MSSDAKSETKKSWGGRILLILSLALNLFLVGLMAGGMMWGRYGPGGMGPAGMGSLTGLSPKEIRRLASDEGTREKLHAVMKGTRSEFRPAMRQSFEAHRAIHEALKTNPYDPKALTDAFELSRQADDKMRRLSQDTVEKFVNSLTDEERQSVFKAMEETQWGQPREGRRGAWRDRGEREGKRHWRDRRTEEEVSEEPPLVAPDKEDPLPLPVPVPDAN